MKIRFKPFLVIVIPMLFLGCTDDRLFEGIHYIENKTWDTNEKIPFEFEVKDTNAVYDMLVNIRISGYYPYSNLFMQVYITDPNGHLTKKLVEYTLAEASGKWVGKGLGDLYDYRLPSPDLNELRIFSIPGKYTVELRQVMRVEKLEGVMGVGIRVVKKS